MTTYRKASPLRRGGRSRVPADSVQQMREELDIFRAKLDDDDRRAQRAADCVE